MGPVLGEAGEEGVPGSVPGGLVGEREGKGKGEHFYLLSCGQWPRSTLWEKRALPLYIIPNTGLWALPPTLPHFDTPWHTSPDFMIVSAKASEGGNSLSVFPTGGNRAPSFGS